MKKIRFMAGLLAAALGLSGINIPVRAEEPVSHIANLIVFVDFQDTVHIEQCYTGDPQIQELFDGDEKNPRSL